ncbi:pilus assembly protein TadG-related protein [Phenylobacterium sp. J426]|uniref:pilus assembly protein TadG-related protein n=1 Tax=Phenylobacterium sp. J426 TaxID=2898439 RepID=UPI002151F09C|nr:pilus assembly protein TadG-related protein [Phenylobacterium sp. J426]MCR5876422.1 pilus assembly protein TadG-related protein [Phenylobacterium sp. J426]
MTRPNLLNDRSGAAAPATALGLVALLGFAGLAVDLGHGYLQRRSSQHAADSAAYSAAVALTAGAADPTAQAWGVAAEYGLQPAQVTVNLPPVSGAYAGSAGAIEVLVQRPGRRFLAGVVAGAPQTIRARAVARTGRTGDACVVALHANASASASETGSADVRLDGCALFANSTSQSALELSGGARLTAKSVNLVGGYSQSSNSTITTTEGVNTGQAAIGDPYEDVGVPPYETSCPMNGAKLASGTYGRTDGRPTVYCNGLTINAGASVTLRPGVHVIDRGALLVNGNATLRGDGVTIVLTSSTGADYATVDIRGGAVVNLSAPTAGPTAGLAFMQDRRAPAWGENKLNGGSSQQIAGALYFPSQTVTFAGGSESGGCTQVVASKVHFLGNARLALNCQGTGVRPAGGRRPLLVE